MIAHFLELIYTLLPAYVANMAPVLVKRLKVLEFFNKPLDSGKSFRNNRITGDNKTWRGLLSAVVFAYLTGIIQRNIALSFNIPITGILSPEKFHIYAALMGFGAMAGDSIKSFFKRRRNIAPGKIWFPFDYIDYPLGAILMSGLFLACSLETIIPLLFLSAVLTPIFNVLMKLIKIKDEI